MELLKKILAISFASAIAMTFTTDVSAMKRRRPDFNPNDYTMVDGTLHHAKKYRQGVVGNAAIIEAYNAYLAGQQLAAQQAAQQLAAQVAAQQAAQQAAQADQMNLDNAEQQAAQQAAAQGATADLADAQAELNQAEENDAQSDSDILEIEADMSAVVTLESEDEAKDEAKDEVKDKAKDEAKDKATCVASQLTTLENVKAYVAGLTKLQVLKGLAYLGIPVKMAYHLNQGLLHDALGKLFLTPLVETIVTYGLFAAIDACTTVSIEEEATPMTEEQQAARQMDIENAAARTGYAAYRANPEQVITEGYPTDESAVYWF